MRQGPRVRGAWAGQGGEGFLPHEQAAHGLTGDPPRASGRQHPCQSAALAGSAVVYLCAVFSHKMQDTGDELRRWGAERPCGEPGPDRVWSRLPSCLLSRCAEAGLTAAQMNARCGAWWSNCARHVKCDRRRLSEARLTCVRRREMFRDENCKRLLSTFMYDIEQCYVPAAESLQCPTLCDPVDGSPPGSPVPGSLQARTLERVAISFSSA